MGRRHCGRGVDALVPRPRHVRHRGSGRAKRRPHRRPRRLHRPDGPRRVNTTSNHPSGSVHRHRIRRTDLVAGARGVLARYGRLGGSQFAAAISYRALFSLVPLATFAATVLAQVLSSSGADRHDFVSAIADRLGLSPDGAAGLDALITSVPSPWSIAGLVSLGLALL